MPFERLTIIIGNVGLVEALKNKQSLSNTLTSLAGLGGQHNQFPYFSGPETMTLGDITDIGKGIISRETLAEFYLYVGIKTAGLRDVGTGANQIPDMSAFPASDTLYALPSGIVHQVFEITTTGSGDKSVNFPTAFANKCLGIFTQQQYPSGINAETLAVTFKSRAGFNYHIDGDNSGTMTYSVLAVGR